MLAHIEKNGEIIREQSIADHTKGVMDYAFTEGKKINIGNIARFTALFHDMGKAKKEFEEYLKSQLEETGKQARGSVNHSSAGAKYIYSNFTKDKTSKVRFLELVAYAVTAHHGLFDISEQEGKANHFIRRMQEMDGYQESVDNFTKEVLSNYDVERLYEQAFEEYRVLCEKIKCIKKTEKEDVYFYFGCIERMLLSILMDADWSDTAAFASGTEHASVQKFTHLDLVRENYQSYMEELQKKFEQRESSEKEKRIMQLRNTIQKECIAFGKNPAGIYCLPIPTGGGKTLSGLGYALEFWKEHPDTERMIYLSPYISITEQNAQVIKEALGEKELVLEHHSNVINESEQEDKPSAFIDWNAPFICSTMVQFLNTLFSAKKQSIVRFHKLKNAVIVIDEVQSLPLKTIHTFNMMMNYLKEFCNTTIILCTATQPQLEETPHPILYSSPRNMMKDVSERFEQFERVKVTPLLGEAGRKVYDYDELCGLVLAKMEELDSVLVILNTKYAVQTLYDAVMNQCEDTIEIVYLTTNLCAEHRTRKIESIKRTLKEGGRKVLIISTNLIEAGVDLSVECVIRSIAGLDSIAQAAGRCNRHGEQEKGQVLLVSVEEEKKERMEELMSAIGGTERIIYRFKEQKGNSLLAPEWMNQYYEELYHVNQNKMDFNVKGLGSDNTIYNLLSRGFCMENKETLMNQAFKTAGEHYNVIDQNGVEVIVPYGKGNEYISELEQASELTKIKHILKKVQRYTVSVLQYKARELEEKGVIRLCENVPGIYIANSYHKDLGIVSKHIELIF